MIVKIRVLQIHNFFDFRHPILTGFSWLIRKVTNSKWNHNAIEIEVNKPYLLRNKGLLAPGKYIIESVGKGVIYTPQKQWIAKGGRIILPLEFPSAQVNLETIEDMIGQPYGFLDILKIAKYIAETKWIGLKREWRKVAFKMKGYICTEVVAELLGLNTDKLWLPGDFVNLPNVVIGQEFTT